MAGAPDARVRAFLAETLALWQVDARLEAVDAPGIALVRTPSGVTLRIERVPRPASFRWIVRIGEGTAPGSERPCASLVGLLNALRRALGVERGSPIRIGREDA